MKTGRLIAVSMLAMLVPGVAAAQAEPTAQATAAARSRGPCGDPWVTIALETVYGRVTDRRLCQVSLWAEGRWRSYGELLTAVRTTRYDFTPVKLGGDGPLAGQFALGIYQNGILAGAGSASLVAAGGGNMVAAGGGNLVAAGGGNLIGQDGGSLISLGQYSLLSKKRAKVF